MLLHIPQGSEESFQVCLITDLAIFRPKRETWGLSHVISNATAKGQNHSCGLGPDHAWARPLPMGHLWPHSSQISQPHSPKGPGFHSHICILYVYVLEIEFVGSEWKKKNWAQITVTSGSGWRSCQLGTQSSYRSWKSGEDGKDAFTNRGE